MVGGKVIDRLRSILLGSRKLVAFTGAGLSAESGIPTYRGAGGLWTRFDPAKYADFTYFKKDPTYFWTFFRELRYPVFRQAEPNAAHIVLRELEKRGILFRVITQNIDGLHQQAGQEGVIELHGNSRSGICMDCSKIVPMEEVVPTLAEMMPPRCNCGGLLKPNVVLFGEPLPQDQLTAAWDAAQRCDTFIVIGSSLVVYPAAHIPVIAKKSGACLVILNLEVTLLDELADLVIHGSAPEVLAEIVTV